MTVQVADLVAHPCYPRLLRIYRNARVDWGASAALRAAAAAVGLEERRYCDQRLEANQLQWSAAGTGDLLTAEHLDHAYASARP